jgi:hypothetical protein
MKYIRQILLLILLGLQFSVFCQRSEKKGNDIPASFCVSSLEYKLYTMINEYRARYDLPPIPLSKSLCYVASAHVKDLFYNHPDKGSCNSHSWSANGNWKPFCYPRDENKKNSVWDKPKELTHYKGKGYEIVYWENNTAVIDSIITLWKSMDYFNSFLMNTGKWNGKKWNAIGISIYENYASAWFGELPDQEIAPLICGTIPAETPKKQGIVKKEPHKKENPNTVSKKVDSLKNDINTAKPIEEKSVTKEPSNSKIHNKTSEPKVHSEVLQSPTGRYYIVVKSQAPHNEIMKVLDDLKTQGNSQAKILGKDNKLRVSIQDYGIKSAADSALREVKKVYKDAWILKF